MNPYCRTPVFCLLLLCTPVLASAEDQPESNTETEAVASGQSVEAQQGVAETLRHKDRAVSHVMDEPLDGSSIETFKAGLENVDQNASEKEYRSLMSALDFLLFYDLGAKRDKAKLYARLNGKSPNDILNQVAGIKGKKNRK